MGSGTGSSRVGPRRFRGARRRGFRAVSLAAAVGLVAAGLGAPATAVGETTRRVSVSSTEAQGNDVSRDPAISADGRYVAFGSDASNLVPGDTNATRDVFVRDRKLGTTRRVSVSSGETQGNSVSFGLPVISPDGRYVAFGSDASNLVPGDTNRSADVFVRDRKLGTTRRVSVSSTEAQGNGPVSFGPAAISSAGRYVAFGSDASNLVPGDTNGSADVFVRDRKLGTTRRVSVSRAEAQGTNGSFGPVISARGRYVAFTSTASNLVPGDTNDSLDVFVRDRELGTTRRVSVSSTGAQGDSDSFGPAISAAGRYVAFSSDASNLVPGDTNGAQDVFVRDRDLGTSHLVSVSSTGAQGNSVTFDPAISAAGRYVAFSSDASNLVPGDTEGTVDVFVRDRDLGTTRRVSVSSTGAQGNRISFEPAISSAGRYVAFSSAASNLVPGDTNDSLDVFVRIRAATR